jgi:uncharacterized protein YhbP (UPF0306 family)
MSLESALAFLGSQELVSLCTASSAGVPHAAPSFFALDGRSVLFTTSATTQTGQNLAANPQAAVAAADAPDPGQTWSDAHGIQLHGPVTALTGADADAAASALRARYAHLDDRMMSSHFFRLDPTSIAFVAHGDSADQEFAKLGVEWRREEF